jgi:hypothetical protein
MILLRRGSGYLIGLMLLAVFATAAGAAEDGKAVKLAKPPQITINPQALQILDKACTALSSAKALTYHAEINYDSVLPSGIKLQFAAAMDVAIQRPDHFAVNYSSDLGGKRVWYDGKTVTLLDPAHMTYTTAAAPSTIDQMFEHFAKRNVSVPLEGFDFSHPCERIRDKLLRGTYVGVGDVEGTDCDHLAFIQKDVDWQIWVSRDKRPLPRKIVITYVAMPMTPQYSAVLSQWNFDPGFPAGFFAPQIPKNAIRVKFLEMKEKHK